MIKVNIGDLNKVIKIQRLTRGKDEQGFPVDDWKTIATPRASIKFYDKLLRENFELEGTTSTQVFQFTFRYFPNLLTKDRIVYTENGIDKIYEISGVDNLEGANRFYTVYAREICL